MIIKNLTKTENIVLVSLKEKKEDQDIVLSPRQVVDLDSFMVSDEKIKRSNELRTLIKDNKVQLYTLSNINTNYLKI